MSMYYHERNLPHCYPPGATLFLTWRLFGSPIQRAFASESDKGLAFAQSDRLLDRADKGPLWLKDARIAQLVADSLVKGEIGYRLYERFAWVIMPNHVHIVIRPLRRLPDVMRWLKGSTARSANLVLGRTGHPFWQYETYDHCVRNTGELNRVVRYVERNPVTAGLCGLAEDWLWSSASAGQRPTPLIEQA
jgi:putative transposase